MNAKELQIRLRSLGNPQDAAILARFFKTGPGEYGEGDVFIGVRVPTTRKVAKEFQSLPLSEVVCLLHSKIHEERLAALLILVLQASKGDEETRKKVYELYLANTQFINNWDLVDLSAPQLVGNYLYQSSSQTARRRLLSLRENKRVLKKWTCSLKWESVLEQKSRKPLYRLAKSSWLWDRRISILATFHFIRQGDFADTLQIAAMLLGDKDDLIHKAVGWMLREVGKRDPIVLETFLEKHWRAMPRTTLRYAIERFSETKRQEYLARR